MWIHKIKSKLKQSGYGRKLRLHSCMKNILCLFLFSTVLHCISWMPNRQMEMGKLLQVYGKILIGIFCKKASIHVSTSMPAWWRDISACTFVLSIYVQSRKAAFSNPDVLDMKNCFASHIRLRWSYPSLPFPLNIFYHMACSSEMKQNS